MTTDKNNDFDEALRNEIIRRVRGVDDRQMLLRIASYVERMSEVLAEKENNTSCE